MAEEVGVIGRGKVGIPGEGLAVFAVGPERTGPGVRRQELQVCAHLTVDQSASALLKLSEPGRIRNARRFDNHNRAAASDAEHGSIAGLGGPVCDQSQAQRDRQPQRHRDALGGRQGLMAADCPNRKSPDWNRRAAGYEQARSPHDSNW
jgi:hypothetical protein